MSEHRDPLSLFNHIFKTPLTSVKVASELITKHLSAELSKKDSELLNMIVRNAKTLELRISQLLEHMKVEDESVHLQLPPDILEEIHSLKFEPPVEEVEVEVEPEARPAEAAAPQPAPAAPAATAAPEAAPAPQKQVLSEEMKAKQRKTILVADDTADIRSLVAEALRDEGYTVEEANDGQQAWYVVKNFKPDLLILDGLMPKKDGFTISHDAKTYDPDSYKPKVILMTAVYKKQHYQSEAQKKYGVDVYMIKPFDVSTMLENVNKLLKEGGS